MLQNFLCNCSGLFKNVGLSEFATFILHNDTLKIKVGNYDNRDLNEKARNVLSEVESFFNN